mgnify:CR=1 FL=1
MSKLRHEVVNVELADKIVSHFRKNGYLLAKVMATRAELIEDVAENPFGRSIEHPYGGGISIIDFARSTRYSQLRYGKPWYVGNLRINANGAEPDKKWQMVCCGILNVPRLGKVLNPLSKEFGVSIEYCPLTIRRYPLEKDLFIKLYPGLSSLVDDFVENDSFKNWAKQISQKR